jgi:uncharacterized protein (TIGR03437 family)
VTEVAVETYHYLRIDLDGGALTVRATSLDSAEIERWVLRPKPAIRRQGVVSTGDYSAVVAPGSLVSIFGRNLAASPKTASAMPLPLELGGLQVRVDGQDCPLLFVSPDQVNTQIPYGVPATTVLEVLTGNGSTETSVSILPTAPSILVVTTNEAPATFASLQAGKPMIVYVTGLGACSETTTAGNSASTQIPAIAPVEVWLADWKIRPSYSGLTPGFSGVYQVNFTVSAAIPAGTYPLRIATADAISRAVPFVVE